MFDRGIASESVERVGARSLRQPRGTADTSRRAQAVRDE
jgi:hypothetical protein